MPDEVSLDAAVEVHPLNRHYETYVVVRMVLSRLSRRDQEVILLRLEQGLPFKKVAQRLGISLEAAKSRYRRAIQHFAEEWNA
jgi:RNA polymerase sigma factor (sigma-70 family)